MISNTDRMIGIELKRELNSHLKIIEMKVFGSRARGEAENDSDFDVFIVVNSNGKKVKERIREISWEIGLRFGIVISPLIFSVYELTGTPLRSSPIVKAIEKDGISI